MKIGRGVSELWGVENRPLPLTWPMAYTTACTTVQAVICIYLGNNMALMHWKIINSLSVLTFLSTLIDCRGHFGYRTVWYKGLIDICIAGFCVGMICNDSKDWKLTFFAASCEACLPLSASAFLIMALYKFLSLSFLSLSLKAGKLSTLLLFFWHGLSFRSLKHRATDLCFEWFLVRQLPSPLSCYKVLLC